MIWNEKIECMDLNELKNIQSERLSKLAVYVYKNCPVYKKKFDAAGVSPDDIKTIDDIVKLPFTVKEDMRDNYPFGLFSVPQSKVAEIHVSSGTTGNPTVVGYTKDDVKLWSDVIARSLCCAGAESFILRCIFTLGVVCFAFDPLNDFLTLINIDSVHFGFCTFDSLV